MVVLGRLRLVGVPVVGDPGRMSVVPDLARVVVSLLRDSEIADVCVLQGNVERRHRRERRSPDNAEESQSRARHLHPTLHPAIVACRLPPGQMGPGVDVPIGSDTPLERAR